MVPTEEMKKKLDELSQVSAASGTSSYTPQFAEKNTFSERRIQKHIYDCFDKGQFDELEQDLKNYGLSEQDLERFFLSDRGGRVFFKALATSTSSGPLALLIKVVPQKTLVTLFEKNNCRNFQIFMGAESSFERRGWYAEQVDIDLMNHIQLEKFRLLLQLAPEAVEAAFNAYTPQEELTETIRQNFETALKEYKESHRPSQALVKL